MDNEHSALTFGQFQTKAVLYPLVHNSSCYINIQCFKLGFACSPYLKVV